MPGMESGKTLFIVRLWDGFDGIWMDVSEALPEEEAQALCREKNLHHLGKEVGSYSDIDYYAVFPAETRMIFSGEHAL